MKLSLEQHAGLGKIARYFEKIESIADNMSGDEDLLPQEFRQNKIRVFNCLKENQMTISEKRQHIFNQHGGLSPQSSIVNLNVIINEDRF